MDDVSLATASRRAIERLISDALGAAVRTWERIEPRFVYRVHLGGEPSSVIVKRLRDDPSGFRIDPAQVATEVAALRFVEKLGLGIAPRVLASDVSAQVIVLEDLHPRVPLPDVILSEGPHSTDDHILEFARTLGDLNAATAGSDTSYSAPTSASSPEETELDRWQETLRSVEGFGVRVPSGVRAEIAAMFEELGNPGPFLAMSNGDPGTNNFLVAPGLPGKLIDFEFARFRHALMDAAHIHVQSPQWVTLPDPAPAESAYRRALAVGVPEAEDDARFDRGLTAACLGYALVRLHRLEKLARRQRGELSRLQLVATLESAAALTEARRHLRELGGWCADVAVAVRRQWPDTDVDLASLPPWLSRDHEHSQRVVDAAREVGHAT